MVRVVRHKAALLPHTDGSNVFAMWRQCAPHLIHGSLGFTRFIIPNCILIGTAVFAQLTAESPYTSQWTVLFPFKNDPSRGESGPHLIHGFLDPPESTSQTASPLLWPPCVADADITFLPCGFFLSIFLFFPRLISGAAGWMSTIL